MDMTWQIRQREAELLGEKRGIAIGEERGIAALFAHLHRFDPKTHISCTKRYLRA